MHIDHPFSAGVEFSVGSKVVDGLQIVMYNVYTHRFPTTFSFSSYIYPIHIPFLMPPPPTESLPSPMQGVMGPPPDEDLLPPPGVRDVRIDRPNQQTSFGFVLQSNTLRPGCMICEYAPLISGLIDMLYVRLFYDTIHNL